MKTTEELKQDLLDLERPIREGMVIERGDGSDRAQLASAANAYFLSWLKDNNIEINEFDMLTIHGQSLGIIHDFEKLLEVAFQASKAVEKSKETVKRRLSELVKGHTFPMTGKFFTTDDSWMEKEDQFFLKRKQEAEEDKAKQTHKEIEDTRSIQELANALITVPQGDF